MKAVLAVLGKELREAFRDANVLLYSVAFPLILYPLLLWGAVQLMVLQAGCSSARRRGWRCTPRPS